MMSVPSEDASYSETKSLDAGGGDLLAPDVGCGFWIRALARIIDSVVLAMVGFTSGFLCGMAIAIALAVAGASQSSIEETFSRLETFSVIGLLFGSLASTLYHTICEWLHGATLGKRICGLVVLREGGTVCNFGSAAGRSVAFIIDALFFGAVAASSMSYSSKKHRFGDKWFHTVVVKRDELSAGQVRSDWRFLVIFLLSIAVSSILYVTSMLIEIAV